MAPVEKSPSAEKSVSIVAKPDSEGPMTTGRDFKRRATEARAQWARARGLGDRSAEAERRRLRRSPGVEAMSSIFRRPWRTRAVASWFVPPIVIPPALVLLSFCTRSFVRISAKSQVKPGGQRVKTNRVRETPSAAPGSWVSRDRTLGNRRWQCQSRSHVDSWRSLCRAEATLPPSPDAGGWRVGHLHPAHRLSSFRACCAGIHRPIW